MTTAALLVTTVLRVSTQLLALKIAFLTTALLLASLGILLFLPTALIEHLMLPALTTGNVLFG
jgi:hypothetical protein